MNVNKKKNDSDDEDINMNSKANESDDYENIIIIKKNNDR